MAIFTVNLAIADVLMKPLLFWYVEHYKIPLMQKIYNNHYCAFLNLGAIACMHVSSRPIQGRFVFFFLLKQSLLM